MYYINYVFEHEGHIIHNDEEVFAKIKYQKWNSKVQKQEILFNNGTTLALKSDEGLPLNRFSIHNHKNQIVGKIEKDESSNSIRIEMDCSTYLTEKYILKSVKTRFSKTIEVYNSKSECISKIYRKFCWRKFKRMTLIVDEQKQHKTSENQFILYALTFFWSKKNDPWIVLNYFFNTDGTKSNMREFIQNRL